MASSRPGSPDGGYFPVLTDDFHLGAHAQIRYERYVQTNYVKTNTDDLRLSAEASLENREFSRREPAEHAPNRARLGVFLCTALRGAASEGALSSRPFSFGVTV